MKKVGIFSIVIILSICTIQSAENNSIQIDKYLLPASAKIDTQLNSINLTDSNLHISGSRYTVRTADTIFFHPYFMGICRQSYKKTFQYTDNTTN